MFSLITGDKSVLCRESVCVCGVGESVRGERHAGFLFVSVFKGKKV